MVLLMLNSTMAGIVATIFTDQGLEEYFGSFSSSFLSMWQVGTGDSWSSLTRLTQQIYGEWVMVIFTSHNFIMSVMLLNIIVAIMLNSFLEAKERLEQEEHEVEMADRQGELKRLQGPLDILLREIVTYESEQDLDYMLMDLFWLFSNIRLIPKQRVGFQEMRKGRLFSLLIVRVCLAWGVYHILRERGEGARGARVSYYSCRDSPLSSSLLLLQA